MFLSLFLLLTLNQVKCDNAPKPPPALYISSTRANLLTYGTDEIDRTKIKEAMEHMLGVMIVSAQSLTIGDENLEDHFGPKEAGHFHRLTQEICIKRDDLWDFVVWHEFAHAYHATLPYAMTKEWLDVVHIHAGIDAYKLGKFPKNQKFPHKGFLTRYGTKNVHEDIAEWYEVVKCALAGRVYHFFGIDKSDPTYMAKLDLLWKWGFITAGEYEIMKILLENI